MSTPYLTFTRRGLGSEVARLGERTVGEILPCPPRGVSWLVRLPDWPMKAGPSDNVEGARRKIEHEVREWLKSAWLWLPGDRFEVSVQDGQTNTGQVAGA